MDGEIIEVTEQPPKLAKTKVHRIEAVIDRLVIREGIRPRLAESINLALKLSEGVVVIAAETVKGWEDHVLSIHLSCPGCGAGLHALEPRGFSFNSPYGACPTCEGLGVDRLRRKPRTRRSPALRAAARACDPRRGRCGSPADRSTRSPRWRSRRCGGSLSRWILTRPRNRSPGPSFARSPAGSSFLEEVGLGYLSLARGADTLSGGELQRARLATQLGAGLVGVCYVLDEPTAGLHPRDTDQLIASLRRLQAQGNSVVVVEHDEAVIRAADWAVDLGPGAGPDGGQIVATCRPEQLADVAGSITGRYLRQRRPQPPRPGNRLETVSGWIVIQQRLGTQPQGDRSPDPARHFDLRLRRQRLGQEHARP